MPYTRYEAEAGRHGGGATAKGPTFDQARTAAGASGRRYVELAGRGSYLEWTAKGAGAGLVLRFTMPDSADGTGLSGQLTITVNGGDQRAVALSSYHAWQYFDKTVKGNRHPQNNPAAGNGRMRFDEVRLRLSQPLKIGDVLRIEKTVDEEIPYGVDFIELEPIDGPITMPDGFVDVTAAPFGAKPDDGKDDHAAIQAAIRSCAERGKGLFLPPGRYEISSQLVVDRDGLRLQGAGIWHTELYFTSREKSRRGGGFHGRGSNIRMADFHMSSGNNQRDGYRAFERFFSDSVIEDVWLTHFCSGFWIRDRLGTREPTNNLTIRRCRIRNTYADGLNFASGTSNSTLEHSNIRNNGDDATATWSSDREVVPHGRNNTLRHNTVECTYRASGIGVFGGEGHHIHHCIVSDTLGGAGVRVNSTFPGWPFSENGTIRIHDITIIRCGTRANLWDTQLGAINLTLRRYDVNGIEFSKIDVRQAATDGIRIQQEKPNFTIREVNIRDIGIDGTAADGLGPGYGLFVADAVRGWVGLENVRFRNIATDDFAYPRRHFEVRRGGSGAGTNDDARRGAGADAE